MLAGGNLTNRFGLPMDVSFSLGKQKDLECEPETEVSSNVEAFAMSLVYSYERVTKCKITIINASFVRRKEMELRSIHSLRNGWKS